METHSRQDENPPADRPLPWEPDSAAEVLSCTHIFTVQIVQLTAGPWEPGGNGLQHRRLAMTLRLLETLKGELTVRAGDSFELEVEQRREGEYVAMNYLGLWSHVKPAEGTGYLVFAKASARERRSPGVLMQEPICEQLLPPEKAEDVRLARQAEKLFDDVIRQENMKDPRAEAVRRLLGFAQEHRTRASEVFAAYLWTRVGPEFIESQDRPLNEILQLVLAGDANLALRQSVIHDLYASVLLLDAEPGVQQSVVRAFISLLLQDSASPLHDHLAEVELYNLVFAEEGRPVRPAAQVVPDPDERRRAEMVLNRLDSDGARELARWLAAAP